MNSAAQPPTTAAVAADVERRITAGEYTLGQRLPSEQALADAYRTTRTRVRTALAALARRGVVVARPNSGWYVRIGGQSQTVGEMQPFSRWAAELGRGFGGLTVRREHGPASAGEAAALGIGLGAQVFRCTRVRSLDGRPVMIERSTWAPWLAPAVEALADDVASVFGALAAAGVPVSLGDHRIEAAAASSEDARLLGVRRGSPLLQVTRRSATADGRQAELAVDRYLPDTVAFDVRATDVARTLLPPR